MLQYKTLLAESKTPLLLAQKEIASLQKELDSFRKAVDAKAKERDAMERAAKFAKAETEKVAASVPYLSTIILDHTSSGVVASSTLSRFEAFRGSRETRTPSDGRAATSRRRGDGVDVAGTPSRRHRLDGVRTIREASRESREVRTAPKSLKKPPSASSDRDESRRTPHARRRDSSPSRVLQKT